MASFPPPNGAKTQAAKPAEVVIDGRSYTVEANKRSHSAAGFVGSVAGQMLAEYLRDRDLPLEPENRAALFDKMFQHAEEWRLALDRFERRKLEEYEDEIQGSVSKASKLILPTAGQMMDHLPPGSIPHTGH